MVLIFICIDYRSITGVTLRRNSFAHTFTHAHTSHTCAYDER